MSTSDWKWYAGTNEEHMIYGPCDTREEVIEEGRQDRVGEFQNDDGEWMVGLHVVEARSAPLRFADWIDFDGLIERADESVLDSDRASSEFDEGPFFDPTPVQSADLEARIKQACDDWQTAHGLVFTCQTFSHTRNHGYAVAPHPNDDTPSERPAP